MARQLVHRNDDGTYGIGEYSEDKYGRGAYSTPTDDTLRISRPYAGMRSKKPIGSFHAYYDAVNAARNLWPDEMPGYRNYTKAGTDTTGNISTK